MARKSHHTVHKSQVAPQSIVICKGHPDNGGQFMPCQAYMVHLFDPVDRPMYAIRPILNPALHEEAEYIWSPLEAAYLNLGTDNLDMLEMDEAQTCYYLKDCHRHIYIYRKKRTRACHEVTRRSN